MKTYFVRMGRKYLHDFEMREPKRGVRAIQTAPYSEDEFSPVFSVEKKGFDPRTLKGLLSTLIEWSRWNKCGGKITIEIVEI